MAIGEAHVYRVPIQYNTSEWSTQELIHIWCTFPLGQHISWPTYLVVRHQGQTIVSCIDAEYGLHVQRYQVIGSYVMVVPMDRAQYITATLNSRCRSRQNTKRANISLSYQHQERTICGYKTHIKPHFSIENSTIASKRGVITCFLFLYPTHLHPPPVHIRVCWPPLLLNSAEDKYWQTYMYHMLQGKILFLTQMLKSKRPLSSKHCCITFQSFPIHCPPFDFTPR